MRDTNLKDLGNVPSGVTSKQRLEVNSVVRQDDDGVCRFVKTSKYAFVTIA